MFLVNDPLPFLIEHENTFSNRPKLTPRVFLYDSFNLLINTAH
jgi:hypothetical protein